MKIKKLLLAFFVCCCALTQAQENNIELPIHVIKGYGPFESGLGGIAANSEDQNNPWAKTYLNVSGIPKEWTDAKKGEIETNIYQTVYQNYLSGTLSQEFYETLQKSWNWQPDTLNLSKKPVKCKIAFAFGKDSSGKTKMVVDANNNFDFSDDLIFIPHEIDLNDKINRDSLGMKNSFMVSFERLLGNKIIQEKVPLFIVHMKSYDIFVCNFPQYATAELSGEEIAICSNNFTSPSYMSTSIVLINDSIKNGKKANNENIITVNEYIKIKNNLYKNKGVNWNKNVLQLEKTNLQQNQLYSTQVGFKTLFFEGQNFKTKSKISLDDFKGKYLLIDFWSVWCGPCIQELPNLKALYDKVDKSKIEILGIVGDSQPDALEEMIDKYSITWPQILSDETKTIIKNYEIRGYPTTLLINPEGIIVAKNLRGNDLENKINEFLLK